MDSARYISATSWDEVANTTGVQANLANNCITSLIRVFDRDVKAVTAVCLRTPRGTNWSFEKSQAVPAAKRRCSANPHRNDNFATPIDVSHEGRAY